MKKNIFLFVFLIPIFLYSETWTREELKPLFSAIEKTESANGIAGKNGEAGVYQIRTIYVDDVNRIIGRNAYSYNDRFDKELSEQMMMIYINHYCTEKRIGRKPVWEDIARIHNGGPTGFRKNSTKEYWRKVERNLK